MAKKKSPATAEQTTLTAEGFGASAPADPASITEQAVQVLRVPPTQLVVAGIDYPADPADPYYDVRATDFDATKADDAALVESIRAGWRDASAVSARLDSGRLVVVDGRRRTLAARAAGVAHITVLVTLEAADTSAKELFLFARRANALRVNESALQQAENYQRAREQWNVKAAEFGAVCGLSAHDMTQRLTLLKLVPELKAMLRREELAQSHAWQLAKLPPDRQLEVYQRLLAAGNLTTQAIRREKSADGTEGGAESEGSEGGAESEGSEGSEGSESEAEKKPRAGLTTSELRKIVALCESDDAPPVSDEVIAAFKVVIGALNPKRVKGLQTALNRLAGIAEAKAEKRAAREAAKAEAEKAAKAAEPSATPDTETAHTEAAAEPTA